MLIIADPYGKVNVAIDAAEEYNGIIVDRRAAMPNAGKHNRGLQGTNGY